MKGSYSISAGGETRGDTVQNITDQAANGTLPEALATALKGVVDAIPGARVTVTGTASIEDDAGHLSLTVYGLREAPVGTAG